MKKLLLLILSVGLCLFAYRNGGEGAVGRIGSMVASKVELKPLVDRLTSAVAKVRADVGGAPRTSSLPGNDRRWTFADGTKMEALLIAADDKRAQFRVLDSQGVGQLDLGLLSEPDRERIRGWVHSTGVGGVAGYPLRLKTHRWPEQWREQGGVRLEPIGQPNRWRSRNFEITNNAGVSREVLESITLICESVDGALNALPLPVPINWGRPSDEARKIVIERGGGLDAIEGAAGYWDARTGQVHIDADHLLERDTQWVVFEFDKPEKVQKYDVIVHEVVHQSTAALMFLGVPAWATEGIAEYLSATQFAPAYYQFTNTHVSVRHHIDKVLLGDRIVKNRRMRCTHLRKMMNRSLPEWNLVSAADPFVGALQYHEALILVDYFFHRDHPDGVHFRRYLESVLSGVPEKEARDRHLMRGRTYEAIEREIAKLWQPLGFTMHYQEHGDIQLRDVAIDWDAEDVKRTIASRRAMASRGG